MRKPSASRVPRKKNAIKATATKAKSAMPKATKTESTQPKMISFGERYDGSIRLVPEPVPAPMWGKSAYHRLKGAAWKRIRANEMARSNNRCEICGEPGVICHEVFLYDDNWREGWCVAMLFGFEIHCRPCDAVTHIGRINATAPQELPSVMAHMCRINGITRRKADRIVDDAFNQWEERSSKPYWMVMVHGPLEDQYPELQALGKNASLMDRANAAVTHQKPYEAGL